MATEAILHGADETRPMDMVGAKGRGLNSIPIRFSLMSAVLTTLCVLAWFHHPGLLDGGGSTLPVLAFAVATIAIPTTVTYLAASKLTKAIQALRRSTEAIIAGDTNSPVDVECACEVGGLADSFRAMIKRLNGNILRMNVLAYTDAVTGLPNRAVISHLLGLIARAPGGKCCSGAMLFIDLDGFKRVNDTLGHDAGDELLRQVSDRIITEGFGLTRSEVENCTSTFGELCQTCPDSLVFARFAGDEFVAILPGEQDEGRLATQAGRIIEVVGAPFAIHGNDVRIGASIGIARVPIDTDDPEQLLGYADIAMYAAKDAGKGQYRFFDATLREVAVERTRIEADLRVAIEQNQLELHYQPKLDSQTLAFSGVEALVRWNHPERGMIPPNRFIGIAEQNGLMPMLGSAIIDMAARQSAIWAAEGTPTPIAVNVSAVQFDQPGFVASLLATLARHGVPSGLFEVEITETMIMSDFSVARGRLEQLRAAGVRISIDDFGTGYSNLSQLTHLPFDVLKIDKSLIDGLDGNAKSQAMVTAIVYMAHALGHKVVAEGIESFPQYDFLKKLDCDIVQGFLFGKPMNTETLRAWRKDRAMNIIASMRCSISEKLSAA